MPRYEVIAYDVYRTCVDVEADTPEEAEKIAAETPGWTEPEWVASAGSWKAEEIEG
jgi:hypothetical protein